MPVKKATREKSMVREEIVVENFEQARGG